MLFTALIAATEDEFAGIAILHFHLINLRGAAVGTTDVCLGLC
jgi:hypothetical protein